MLFVRWRIKTFKANLASTDNENSDVMRNEPLFLEPYLTKIKRKTRSMQDEESLNI